ncbi:unnamed protein product [Didymodactylos carnosus]|uniref:diacylglycerol cholinephosphotransferase n=1 Tax=Didymodactylos carnosus TaxID=1234261 RepID=A0A814BM53_9BILA|nr:unnamed protein product [Didymodactylos carnosus]CAF0928749.1 unnamed protein product [Didymodactylos carnosus]CAF3523448.1 unnamed protein product [Didymodactylos carnosus]CAF3707065.1 unnamed protein product [Didymodactylos carnosus]
MFDAISVIMSSKHNNIKLYRIKRPTVQLETDVKDTVRKMPVVLTDEQLVRLKQHEYASEGNTLFDPFMEKFWTWLVQYCPLWMAPNLITILGLALNIGTSILLIVTTHEAKESCSRWMYIFTAFGLFFYQSLDPGEQARRTNSQSPLGELFDHGCDSVSAIFVTIACCCGIQLGVYPWLMFWCCILSYFAFYCAHWQTYISGKLRFGRLDCTETQFSFITFYIISTIYPNFWTISIPFVQLDFRILAALLIIGSTLWSSYNNCKRISEGGCGIEGSSVAQTSIVFPAIPIFILIVFSLITANNSKTHLLEKHTSLYLLAYGIVFSKFTNRLIVYSVFDLLSSSNDQPTTFEQALARYLEYKERFEKIENDYDEFQTSSLTYEQELETQLEQLTQQNRRFQSELFQERATNEQYHERTEQTLKQYDKRIDHLQNELHGKNNLNEKLTAYIRELEQQNDDLERGKRTLAVSLETFEKQLNQALEQNALLENELDEKEQLTETVQRLRDETRDLREELDVLHKNKQPPTATNNDETINSSRMKSILDTTTTTVAEKNSQPNHPDFYNGEQQSKLRSTSLLNYDRNGYSSKKPLTTPSMINTEFTKIVIPTSFSSSKISNVSSQTDGSSGSTNGGLFGDISTPITISTRIHALNMISEAFRRFTAIEATLAAQRKASHRPRVNSAVPLKQQQNNCVNNNETTT